MVAGPTGVAAVLSRPDTPDAPGDVTYLPAHHAVVYALGTLPLRQREVLVLRYYGGLSEQEIADAAGISKGTVKSTASGALEALQHAMQQAERADR